MEWTDEEVRYGMVRYGTVLPLGGERDAMYVCVRARVLGWAVLCWAVLCGAVLASLSEFNEKKMKVKDKKRK